MTVGTDAKTTSSSSTTTTTTTGKRKEPPLPSPAPRTYHSPPNSVVDTAFKRLFGYSWGTTFDLSNSKVNQSPSVERQMVQIFGTARTARILNLPWEVVAPLSCDPKPILKDSYNPAAILTTKIVTSDTASISMPVSSPAAAAAPASQSNKRIRLEKTDYEKIALPSHMLPSSSVAVASAPPAAAPATSADTSRATSNIDSVLSQIAGKKQLNTVEKSSNDWEGFKETDKTLQDELERQAQGKNAYLVKQDFLNRVDQRTFELEKEGRDRERSRRAAESK